MAKILYLDKEDSKRYKERGYIYYDKYIVVYDRLIGGFEYGVCSDEVDYFDEKYDELESVFIDQEKTELIDTNDYDDDDDDDDYEDEDNE